jgi:hypothetical protein
MIQFIGEIPTWKITKKMPKKIKLSKYLKNRPLPIFSCNKYNEGFKDGYNQAIKLIKEKGN